MAFQAPNNVMVIGLGGTGKLVCTYLKKALLEAAKDYMVKESIAKGKERVPPPAYYDLHFGRALPEGVRLVALDLDLSDIPAVDLDFRLDSDPVVGEVVGFNQPLDDVKRSIVETERSDPRIGPWLEPEDAERMVLPLSAVEYRGAGQQRQYSRASFLLSLADPRNVRKFHEQLLKPAIDHFRQRMEVRSGLRNYFFVVGSVAGGVGSGIFLDVGQIVRYYATDLPNSELIGIFVLSRAFTKNLEDDPHVNRELVAANTFAAMRELRRFMLLLEKGYPFEEYRENFAPTGLRDDKGPFQSCFFVDATRNNGDLNTVESIYTVCPAIADYLLLHCVEQEPIVPDYNNIYRAIVQHGRPYATFGIHSFIFPIEDIIADFSHRLGIELQDRLLMAKPPQRDLGPELERFFKESDRYYGQHLPPGEFLIGTPDPANRLALLDEIFTVVNTYRGGTAGYPFDLDQLLTKLRLPKRFVGGQVLDLEAGYTLPLVNVDSQGQEQSDHLKDNDIIQNHLSFGRTEPEEVIKQANKLLDANLGTQNDVAYDRTRPGIRKTYHSVLKYYLERLKEIYGGYTDREGSYCPGLLENTLKALLNQEVSRGPKVDAAGNPMVGRLSRQPLLEARYRFQEAPLETAIAFCAEVLTYIEEYEKIIKAAYDDRIKLDPIAKTDLLMQTEQEAQEAESEFKGATFPYFKAARYLQKMQDLLQVRRWAAMHGYYVELLKALREITLGWKGTLERFRDRILQVRQDLEQSRRHLTNVRHERLKIRVRTYLSRPGSPLEEALYQELMDKEVRRDPEGRSVSRRETFFETVWLDFVPDPTEVGKTGRRGIVRFIYNAYEPLIYSKEDVLINAAPFCDEVRDKSLWELIQGYRDQAGQLRYAPRAGEATSTQLVSDLQRETYELVRYDERAVGPGTIEVEGRQVSIGRDNACYAPWITPSGPDDRLGQYAQAFQTEVGRILSRGIPTAPNLGQAYKIVGVRTTHLMAQEHFAEYQDVAKTYRDCLRRIYAGGQRGTPLHTYLGEKYAAKYELEIMEKRSQLDLPLADGEQFYLPLELIFALENPQAFTDFLWAGVFGLLAFRADPAGNPNYAVRDAGGNDFFLTKGGPDSRDNLIDALLDFTSVRDAPHERIRREVKEAVATERTTRMNTDRQGYADLLRSILRHSEGPLNRFAILFSGPDYKKIITDRHPRAVEYSAEERLEVLLKLLLLREIEMVAA